MIERKKMSHKILPFVPAKPSQQDGKLERWFRGVIQSNHDLMTALERLSDSYKGLLGGEALTERDQAILLAVQVTLSNARNAQNLS
jgi:hypothetical protein